MLKTWYCLAIIMALSLVGCNSDTVSTPTIATISSKGSNLLVATATSTTIPLTFTPLPTYTLTQTLTPSATPLPTFTPTPSPEAIPTLVYPPPVALSGFAPRQFSPLDAVISNQNLLWYIKTLSIFKEIDGLQPKVGKQYLVLQGYIYNYNPSRAPLYDADFPIIYGTDTGLNPDPNLMGHLKNLSDFASCDYPNRNVYFLDSQKLFIEGLSSKCVNLVYETDINITEATFGFRPNNAQIQTLTLAIYGDNYGTREVYKIKENDVSIFSIVDTNNSDEQILSTTQNPAYVIENCHAVETTRDIDQSNTKIDKQITATQITTETVDTQRFAIPATILKDLVSKQVTQYLTEINRSQTETQTQYSESVSDKLKIPANTITTISDSIQIVERVTVVTLRAGNLDIYATYKVHYERIVRKYSDAPCS